MNTDPIADMLNRIKNAATRRFLSLTLPTSRIKEAVADILVKRGYLSKAEVVTNEAGQSQLKLTLSYHDDQPVIHGVDRISKPGRRIHKTASGISKLISSKRDEIIVSTSRGLMTGREAVAAKVGGEVLFKVW